MFSTEWVLHELTRDGLADIPALPLLAAEPTIFSVQQECDRCDDPGSLGLAASELARLTQFQDSARRLQFIAARAIVRTILARWLALTPEQVALDTTANGKPFVRNRTVEKSEAISFSYAHSDSRLLFAFCREREIGVDLEKIRDISARERISAQFFSAAESKMLAQLDETDRHLAFFQLWSGKEAVVKAIGGSVFRHLHDITFSRTGDMLILSHVPATAEPVTAWRLIAVQMEPGYAAAVAMAPTGFCHLA